MKTSVLEHRCKKLLVLFIFLLVLIGCAFLSRKNVDAIDLKANSCSASDIQSTIEKVIETGGGTVNIPACQADDTWGKGDYIYVKTDVTLRLKGSGIDTTVIGFKDGATPGNRADPSTGIFFGGSGLVEISDFTFRGSDTAKIATGIKIYSMNTENLRVHHLRIQKFYNTALYLCQNPVSPMIVDHNEIGDQYGRGMYGIRVHGTNRQSDYIIPASFGVNNPTAAFIEDNIFDKCYHSVSAFATSNVVFRHNKVKNPTSYIDGHGPCFDVGCRRDNDPNSGTYIYEIYDNTIDCGRYPWGVNIRGGTGIITDNSFISCNIGFRLEMERCSRGPNCRARQGCSHSNTDTNVCYQSPYQYWVWNNRSHGRGQTFGTDGNQCIRENHEYHLRAPQSGDPVVNYTKYAYPHPVVLGNQASGNLQSKHIKSRSK